MPTVNDPILSFSKVSHVFPGQHTLKALDSVSFDVQQEEIVALVGPSGSGKSTLLRIAANLIPASGGSVTRAFTRAAMIFQDFALFPWLTTQENVEFGLRMHGTPALERVRLAREKLQEVGLSGFGSNHPKDLSGGMRQRVGIARALAITPDLLLMDEPFSALDSITGDGLKKDVLQIWQKQRFTILIVVHTIADAVELADSIVVFSQRPGTVKEIFRNPLPRPRDMRSVEAYKLIDAVTARIDRSL